MKPWAQYTCPRCGLERKERGGVIVTHPCPKATKYDNRHDNPHGAGMIQLREQES